MHSSCTTRTKQCVSAILVEKSAGDSFPERLKPLVLIQTSGFLCPRAPTIQRKEVPEAGFPTINLACTGANIVRLRKAAGLTVHDLQTVFGFNSPQAIYKWQNGTALPTVGHLIVLAALLQQHFFNLKDLFIYRFLTEVRRCMLLAIAFGR